MVRFAIFMVFDRPQRTRAFQRSTLPRCISHFSARQPSTSRLFSGKIFLFVVFGALALSLSLSPSRCTLQAGNTENVSGEERTGERVSTVESKVHFIRSRKYSLCRPSRRVFYFLSISLFAIDSPLYVHTSWLEETVGKRGRRTMRNDSLHIAFSCVIAKFFYAICRRR